MIEVLQILGVFILFAIVIALLKFFFAFIMRCCVWGILAFLTVGAITGLLAAFGQIEFSTAWMISKWAFFIGVGFNIIEVVLHPLRAIKDAWGVSQEMSFDGVNTVNTDGDGNSNRYSGMHCCANCRYNTNSNGVSCNWDPGKYIEENSRCGMYAAR